MEQQYEDGDGDKPLTLNRSEQSYNKLMKSPSFTEAEKQLMMRIRNTKMPPRMRTALLSRSGLARKVSNMLGINKSVVQTPKAQMRIANNIYTRVNTKKIIVKSIVKLSQKDLDASTSLFVVRVNARESTNMVICGTDMWGTKYSIPIKIDISPHFDYYQKGARDLATIIRRNAIGHFGCIYYVLNATNAHEAKRYIETYANKMGTTHLHGKMVSNFCAEEDLANLARKYSYGSSSGGRKSGKRRTRRTDAKRH